MKPGSKYRPLFEILNGSGQEQVQLSFREIETALGERLPPSARKNRGWWSNRKGAPQASAWMNAGYHVQGLSLEGERVLFARPLRRYQVQREGDTIAWDAGLIKALRQHMALSQSSFAQELGVRQQTVSEWETGLYAPKRAMCKYLTLVAEQAGFVYSETTE